MAHIAEGNFCFGESAKPLSQQPGFLSESILTAITGFHSRSRTTRCSVSLSSVTIGRIMCRVDFLIEIVPFPGRVSLVSLLGNRKPVCQFSEHPALWALGCTPCWQRGAGQQLNHMMGLRRRGDSVFKINQHKQLSPFPGRLVS